MEIRIPRYLKPPLKTPGAKSAICVKIDAYLLAKIGADTAENERNFAKNWQLPRAVHAVPLDLGLHHGPVARVPARCRGGPAPTSGPERSRWAKEAQN